MGRGWPVTCTFPPTPAPSLWRTGPGRHTMPLLAVSLKSFFRSCICGSHLAFYKIPDRHTVPLLAAVMHLRLTFWLLQDPGSISCETLAIRWGNRQRILTVFFKKPKKGLITQCLFVFYTIWVSRVCFLGCARYSKNKAFLVFLGAIFTRFLVI